MNFGGRIKMNIIGCQPGDKVPFKVDDIEGVFVPTHVMSNESGVSAVGIVKDTDLVGISGQNKDSKSAALILYRLGGIFTVYGLLDEFIHEYFEMRDKEVD